MFKIKKADLSQEEVARLSGQIIFVLQNRVGLKTDSWPSLSIERTAYHDLAPYTRASITIDFLPIESESNTDRGHVYVSLEGFTDDFEFTDFKPFHPTMKGKEVQDLQKMLKLIFMETLTKLNVKQQHLADGFSWLMKNAKFK